MILKQQKQGFTLIELVMVIVIIGILAAIALPKFANLTSQARTASNQGIGGAVSSAAAIAHAAWIAAGSTGTSVTLENASVSVNANGWPDNGMALTATLAGCTGLLGTMLVTAPSVGNPCSISSGNCYTATLSGTTACVFTLTNNGTSVTPATTITYTLATGGVVIAP